MGATLGKEKGGGRGRGDPQGEKATCSFKEVTSRNLILQGKREKEKEP